MSEKFVTVSDVHVGDIVQCTVKELEPTGAHLSMGQIIVFAPATHVSDVPVKNIKTKLSVGKRVKARVRAILIKLLFKNLLMQQREGAMIWNLLMSQKEYKYFKKMSDLVFM